MSPMPQGTVARIAQDGSFDFAGSRFPPGDYFITAIEARQARGFGEDVAGLSQSLL